MAQARDRESVVVRFQPAGIRAVVPRGSTILDAARSHGLEIDAPCGGHGTCGACRVTVQAGTTEPTPNELDLLTSDELSAGARLACHARVTGDVTVVTRSRKATRILDTVAGVPEELRAWSLPDMPQRNGFGVAVDIGTTTLAANLVDLHEGTVAGRASALNPQRMFGADVMSRISAATEFGVDHLREPLVAEVERMLLSMLADAEISEQDLSDIVVVGNTAMTGLLQAEDVSPLGRAPYSASWLDGATVRADALGMSRLWQAALHILPGSSAFIGADVVAGLAACGITDDEGPTLFVDLGTNGEIVLVSDGVFRATSTAAGPALEGASIEHGLMAEEGAIERVVRTGTGFELEVIGGGEPRGICGSGLIDAIAMLLDAKVIDSSGRFLACDPGHLHMHVDSHETGDRFVLDMASQVHINQRDIRQFQLAASAVRTGIALLLEDARVGPDAVRSVVFAGGFGTHTSPDSLVRTGLIAAEWRDRMRFAGNSALGGAVGALTGRHPSDELAALAQRIETLDLATRPDFQDRFLAFLRFPG